MKRHAGGLLPAGGGDAWDAVVVEADIG